MKKTELLRQVDLENLRKVAMLTNNVPKYNLLDKSKEDLIVYLSNKFNTKKLHLIMRELMVGKEVQKIAERLRERNGIELSKIFIQKMEGVVSYKREINVGNRIADLAFLKRNGNLIAIEIKANGDNVKKAISQCRDYEEWADFVYLLIESKKMQELEKIKANFDKTGFIVFFEDSGKFKIIKEAGANYPSIDELTKRMPVRSLRELAKKYKIKSSQRKLFIIKDLKKLLSQKNLEDDSSKNIEFEIKKAFLI